MAPGLGFGLGLAAGCGRCVLTGFSGRLAAVLGFGWVVGVGFVGAWALAAAGLLAVGAGLEARLGGVPRGLGGGVLDDGVVVVVDEVVVVVEVVESEAEERAVGDGGGSWAWGRAYDAGSCKQRERGCRFGHRACARVFPGDPCVLVLAWRRYLGCAGTWVTRGVAISAPGRAGVFAGGSRGSGRSIAGCRACPPL